MTPAVLLVLVAFALYSLFSKAISRSLLTLPIIFTALGFALSVPLSASLSPDVIHEGKKILAEITLILILFSDASHVRFKKLVMDWQIPTRMLVIGLPLTIALGTLVALWLNPFLFNLINWASVGVVNSNTSCGGKNNYGCS